MFYRLTKLDSGIRVISETISKVRSVTLGFWFQVGSRDEEATACGGSHFLEHALFKGSKNFPNVKILSQAFDALGADVNAFTSKEYTFYYIKILDEHLEKGIRIFADLLQYPLLRKKDIDSERKVITEEIKMTEDAPDDKIHDFYVENIWPENGLGRPIFGNEQTVKMIDRKVLSDLYQRFYLRSDFILAGAGNLEHKRLAGLTQKYFGGLNNGTFIHRRKKPRFSAGLNVQNRKTEQSHLCIGFESLNYRDPERYVLLVLNNVLSGGMGSRLNQTIREKHGLAYTIYSFNHSYSDCGTLAIYAGTRPENLEKVWTLTRNELELLKKKMVPRDELIRAKEQIKSGAVFAAESTTRRMERLGRALVEERKIITLDELIQEIDRVSAADIKKLAERIMDFAKVSISVIGPHPFKSVRKIFYQ